MVTVLWHEQFLMIPTCMVSTVGLQPLIYVVVSEMSVFYFTMYRTVNDELHLCMVTFIRHIL